MRIFTEEQMRIAEKKAADSGVAFLRLMENAGCACAAEIRNRTDSTQKVVILCGKGKNGGDGFVIARKLVEAGYSVVVLLVFGLPKDSDALYMMDKLKGTDVKILDFTKNPSTEKLIPEADVIVDAIFGIGFHGTVAEPLSSLIRVVNASRCKVFSVDVPSGFECDSGIVKGNAITADFTLAISEGKLCHALLPASSHCGTVVLTKIGVEDEHYRNVDYTAYTFSNREVSAAFPNRPEISNKGDFGKVLCICGSRSFAGAAVLSIQGALRSGAGLVYAAFPESAYPAIASKITEAPLLPMPCDEQGQFAVSSVSHLIKAMQGMNAVVLGCGLGQSAGTLEVVSAVLKNAKCPVILDADGINLLATNIELLREVQTKVILTPHPGEMSRLTGCSIAEILENRSAIAQKFADDYGVTVVLKGANTIVARKNSPVYYVNTTGNSGLSKGGSGDFLAGLLGGFVAQKVQFPAETAVYIHGQCADVVADKMSKRGMLPSDCIAELPYVLSQFE